MKARITITLKPGVLDPQGKAIEGALAGLGFGGIEGVRQGKYIEIEIDESDPERARSRVDDMCRRLLANTVIENYAFEIEGADVPGSTGDADPDVAVQMGEGE